MRREDKPAGDAGAAGERRRTHLALQHAQAALVDVHDGVVDALPLVDDLVVVHAGDDKRRRVVAGRLALALGDRLGRVPAVGAGARLLGREDALQERNVAARKQVEAAVDVYHALADLRAAAGDELAALAARCRRRRRLPEPHIHAGLLGGRVGGVQAHALRHGRARRSALGVGAGALLAGERGCQRPDKVGLGAEEHAPDQVRGRDAGGALDHLEAVGRLDEAVAVLAAAVRGDVVAVHDVAAAKVRDPVERRDVGRVGHRTRDPAAGVDGD